MRKLIILTIIASLIGCARHQEIVILHTNDHHGSMLPIEGMGGLAERASLVARERLENRNVLLLDAGDINGNDYFSDNGNASADILAYNYMGYDAMAIGDHDLNRPIGKLREQERLADFPFLSANIAFDDKKLFTPYIVKDYNGFRIGIFGLTTHDAADNNFFARNLEFDDEIETAKKIVAELKNNEGADMIIALSHLGIRRDNRNTVTSIDLARKVDGIDLIIDGHSHTYLSSPLKLNDTYIVSANEQGKYLGKGIVTVKNHDIESFTWKPIPVKLVEPDPVVENIILPYRQNMITGLSDIIGTARADIGSTVNSNGNSEIGVLATDALMKYSMGYGKNQRFAILDRNIFIKGFNEGDITRLDAVDVFENDNDIVIVTLRGDMVKQLFDAIAKNGSELGDLPQVSRNVAFVIDPVTESVKKLRINGRDIDYAASYSVITTTDMVFGKVPYPALLRRQGLYFTSTSVSSALMEDIRKLGVIDPEIFGR